MRWDRVERPVETRVDEAWEAMARRTHSKMLICAPSGTRRCLMDDLSSLKSLIFWSMVTVGRFSVARRLVAWSSMAKDVAWSGCELGAGNGIEMRFQLC